MIPRHNGDLDDKGGVDAIYDMMESEDGSIGKHLREAKSRFPKPDADAERKPRSVEEMNEEAAWLAKEMEQHV